MRITVRLKNDEEITIYKYLDVETIESIKERISSAMNDDGNHIHFKSDTFDKDLIIMKYQIKAIYFY